MRTTIVLDDDIAAVARELARVEGRSLGAVVSSLARRGLAPRATVLTERDGFPVFDVVPDAPVITEAMVQRALDET